jgi:acyl dehydratase
MTLLTDLLRPGAVWTEEPIQARPVDLVHWAAGADDYTDFHFDVDAARDRGFEGPVVNGPWKARAMRSFLESRVNPYVVSLVSMNIEYRLPDVVHSDLVFTFTVSAAETDPRGRIVADIKATVTNARGDLSTTATLRVAVQEVSTDDSLPIEATKRAVELGKAHGPFTYPIYASDVQRYQQVSGREPGRMDDVMPAAFFGAIDPVERRDLDLDSFLLHLPINKVGGGNAFNEVVYERPIRAGEVLTVMTTYTDVYEKAGRSSRLFFRVRENVYRDESGDKVAVSTNGHVIAYAPSGGTP